MKVFLTLLDFLIYNVNRTRIAKGSRKIKIEDKNAFRIIGTVKL